MADRAHERQELGQTTALVTGAGGFLGSALAEQLAASGARVVGIDSSEGAAVGAGDRVSLDILDAGALRDAFPRLVADAAESTVVFHLAGRGHVGSCRDDPRGAVDVNVVGTINVLEACRAAGVRRVVFPSSALVYRLPAQSPLSEDSPVVPRSIYAATKLASEALLQAYAVEYGMSCTVVRLGNVYGHGAAADTVASSVVRQALAGGPVIVESFAPIRDFIYRDDVVSGLIALLSRKEASGFELLNLSSGFASSVGELAETACAVAGLAAKPMERSPGKGKDQGMTVLSIQRMTRSTGWTPKFSLEAGLRATMSQSRR